MARLRGALRHHRTHAGKPCGTALLDASFSPSNRFTKAVLTGLACLRHTSQHPDMDQAMDQLSYLAGCTIFPASHDLG